MEVSTAFFIAVYDLQIFETLEESSPQSGSQKLWKMWKTPMRRCMWRGENALSIDQLKYPNKGN